MPLSKKRNRDRMRDIRLHAKIDTVPVQPIEIVHCPICGKESHLCRCPGIDRGSFAQYVIDADGNPIYDEP